MFRSYFLVLVLFFVPAQLLAQSEPWRHEASGAIFPREMDGLSISTAEDISGSFDSVIDYSGSPGPVESTTVYLFRAAYPDAQLWFDQAILVVGRQIPLQIFTAHPDQRFSGFGSTEPIGIQRIYTTERRDGPYQTTALVLAQVGPWLLKIRLSSASLDAHGMEERIRRLISAIQFPDDIVAVPLGEPFQQCEPRPETTANFQPWTRTLN